MSGHVSAFWDLLPTLADLVQVACPSDMDGISLLPTLLGRPAEQAQHEFLYWEFGSQRRAARKGPWKAYRADAPMDGAALELYDLAADPAETTNLAAAHPDIAVDMERILAGAHTLSAEFFRGTDEFPIWSELTFANVSPGIQIEASAPTGGYALTSLSEDVTADVRFVVEMQMAQVSGLQTNGVFLFGQGATVADLVRVEVLGNPGRYAIQHGAQRVDIPFAPGDDPFRRFVLEVTYQPATGRVILRENGMELSLTLHAPLTVVDTVGIAVDNARTVFSPIERAPAPGGATPHRPLAAGGRPAPRRVPARDPHSRRLRDLPPVPGPGRLESCLPRVRTVARPVWFTAGRRGSLRPCTPRHPRYSVSSKTPLEPTTPTPGFIMKTLTCCCLIALVLVGVAHPLCATAATTVVGDLPPGALVANPETGANGGSTALAPPPPTGSVTWYVKGQTFTLGQPASIQSVTVRMSETSPGADTTGSLTLELYAVSGGVPTGTPLAVRSDVLPPVSAGDYLTISLDAALPLDAGAFAFVLRTEDLALGFDVQNTGENYPDGALIRSDGSSWQVRSDNEFIFAVSGPSAAFTLTRPLVWPTTFLAHPPQTGPDQVGLTNGVRIGQSFVLPADARVDRVLIQLDDQMPSPDVEGEVALEILATDSRGRPTGSALAGRTGMLPAGLTPGAFLAFDLSSTLSLAEGSYALVFATSDADLRLNSSAGDPFPDGTLLADPGAAWMIPFPLGQDLVFGLVGEFEMRPPPGTGPNVIVIVADDLGWTDLSTPAPNLGNASDLYQTPHIDRLATEGLSFTACYVNPNCAPTRAALLSGQYAPRTGNGVYNVSGLNRGNGTPSLIAPSQNEDVPAATYSLAEMLYDAGYVTAHIGKYHIGGHEGGAGTLPLAQGFDYNFGGTASGNPGTFFADTGGIFHGNVGPELDPYGLPYTTNYINARLAPIQNGNNPLSLAGSNKHLADAEADAAIAFMDSHRAGSLSNYPFYIQYHSYAVHTPIQPRPDLAGKYSGSPGARHDNTDYAGLVEGLDQSVGRILNYLDDPNGDGDPADALVDETLVVFMSDNGGHEGPTENAPLRSRKGSFYDGGIRVPLIVRWPGVTPAGEVTATLVHAVDFYPSLMEIAGGASTQSLDGVSFAAHLAGAPRNRDPIFYHFPGYLDNRARPCSVVIKEVGGKRYKLIYNYDPTYDPTPADDAVMVLGGPWELYNLSDDLSETNNLLDHDYWEWITHQAVAQDLAAELAAWLGQTDSNWAPSYPTVRATGDPLGPPPATIEPVTVPPEQAFRILDAQPHPATTKVVLSWVSDADFQFGIDVPPIRSPGPTWPAGIPGQDGTTAADLPDPGAASGRARYYRAFVAP